MISEPGELQVPEELRSGLALLLDHWREAAKPEEREALLEHADEQRWAVQRRLWSFSADEVAMLRPHLDMMRVLICARDYELNGHTLEHTELELICDELRLETSRAVQGLERAGADTLAQEVRAMAMSGRLPALVVGLQGQLAL